METNIRNNKLLLGKPLSLTCVPSKAIFFFLMITICREYPVIIMIILFSTSTVVMRVGIGSKHPTGL